eukprot:Sspe_Gene.25771::Locus_10443_Transcript_1_1_Confidence_1.000_Length_2315::g.25771::m.25771
MSCGPEPMRLVAVPAGCPLVAAVRGAAAACRTPVEVTLEDQRHPVCSFLRPVMCIPSTATDRASQVAGLLAALRLVAPQEDRLWGSSTLSRKQVEGWISTASRALRFGEDTSRCWGCSHIPTVEYNPYYALPTENDLEGLFVSITHAVRESPGWLVGDGPTLADLSVAGLVVAAVRGVHVTQGRAAAVPPDICNWLRAVEGSFPQSLGPLGLSAVLDTNHLTGAHRFPHDIRLSEVFEAVSDSHFKVQIKNGFVHVNYRSTVDTMPDPAAAATEREARLWAIRRECRGICMCPVTGTTFSRKYHKFFNLGERDNCVLEDLDLSAPHIILEKVDGMLASPYVIDGKVAWATKMGVTKHSALIEEFVAASPARYNEFAIVCGDRGLTSLFEFCTPVVPVIIPHESPKLVLTALRETLTGEYVEWDEITSLAAEFDVPTAKRWDKESLSEEVQRGQHRKEELSWVNMGPKRAPPSEYHSVLRGVLGFVREAEGFVVRFASGDMHKLKTSWYIMRSQAASELENEQAVWQRALSGDYDDFLPLLGPERREAMERFVRDLWDAVRKKGVEVDHRFSQMSKDPKEFHTEVDTFHNIDKRIFRALHAGMYASGVDAVVDKLKSRTAMRTFRKQAPDIQQLVGEIVWADYADGLPGIFLQGM